jgi:hypothetical protein
MNTWSHHLQLALPTHHLHECPSIAQHDLATNLGDEADLLPSILRLARTPDLRSKLVTRLDRRRKPRLELLDVCWVAATKLLDQRMRGVIPREQAVHDRATETHLLAWLGRRVERVVIAIESAEIHELVCCPTAPVQPDPAAMTNL